MSKVIDGVIKEWGERLNYGRVHDRKTRNITGGKVKASTPCKTTTSTRGRLQATVRKAPEVMVKITGGGKGMARIKVIFNIFPVIETLSWRMKIEIFIKEPLI